MHLRHSVEAKDLSDVYAIITDTGFFRANEADIARQLVKETLVKPDEYLFLFAEEYETEGYICYGEIPGTEGSYDLYWLAVYRRHQGLGIGSLLLRGAEIDIAKRGGRQIYISTSGSELYTPTRAFYERKGYETVAVFTDYYMPGDDQVIYRKVL